MKQILKFSFALLFISFSSLTVTQAQTLPTQGVIKYIVDVSGVSDPSAAAMMKDTKTTLTFKDGNTRVDINGSMFQTAIINANKKSTMLFEMMGQKYKTDFTKDMQDARAMKDNSYNVELTNETKKIAGYNCKKAIVKTKDGNSYDVYYTDEIPGGLDKAFPYQKIKGFPMEYQKDSKGVTVAYIVTSIDFTTPVSEDAFKIPDGYEQMPDAIVKQLGGK